MQWHSLLTLWPIRRPCETNEVRSFSRKHFSCSALAQVRAISQVMTHTDCVDEMWSQFASEVFKSGCVLDNHLTLEQLGNYEFNCTQNRRNLLVGMLFAQKAEGNLLQVDNSFILDQQGVCETISPFDGELSKMHEAEVHVFSHSVLCMGEHAMNEPEIKFTKRWNDYLEQHRESASSHHGNEKRNSDFFKGTERR